LLLKYYLIIKMGSKDAQQGVPRATVICIVLFMSSIILLVVVSPKFRFGGGVSDVYSGIGSASRVTVIAGEPEIFKPRDRQKAQSQDYVVGASSGPSVVPIDLMNMLGTQDYYGGISFDVLKCAAPIPTAFPKSTELEVDEVIKKFTNALLGELAGILKVDVKTLKPDMPVSMIFSPTAASITEAESRFANDPRSLAWADAISGVMSRFMVYRDESDVKTLLVCKDNKSKKAENTQALGTNWCPELTHAEIGQQLGFHAMPFISVGTLAHDAMKYGVCTKPPGMRGGYGQWLKKERMFKKEWATFDTHSADIDHVVFLFDVLYEKLKIFTKQYWLGVITMQNPFDMFSIADIIYTVKPDLMIEAGTANGGSAVLWGSIFELSGLYNSKIVTIDINEPSWTPGEKHWGGQAREDPRTKPFWQKYVTFIKGSSTELHVQEKIREMAKGARRVLVLLDSNHASDHVRNEMEALCPLVTVGSYCIVEDTKMSRWSADGPLSSVFTFMEKHPEFEVDRSRELLYTHHVSGYIRRIK